jgi:hypothetical protein
MLLYFFPFSVNHKVGETCYGVPTERTHVAEAHQRPFLDIGNDATAEAQQAHDAMHPSPPVPIPTRREEAEAENGVHFTIP